LIIFLSLEISRIRNFPAFGIFLVEEYSQKWKNSLPGNIPRSGKFLTLKYSQHRNIPITRIFLGWEYSEKRKFL
jgi:hypothetical protein